VKRWAYAPIDTFCGSCGATVPQGKPYLEVQITNVKTRYRCEKCAGQPVDVDQLEAAATRTVEPTQPSGFFRFGDVARFDPRMAQTGEKDE
jgi:hypothetical protein